MSATRPIPAAWRDDADQPALIAGERRRIFEDAQRQADSVFAQYQLSQLVALGGDLGVMAASVIAELVRVADAVAGAIWLTSAEDGSLVRCAAEPDPDVPGGVAGLPDRFGGLRDADGWARAAGWHGVTLDERREIGDDE